MPKISSADYRALAAFRHEMRKFLAFSEAAARAAGVEPQQHQLLLAVRGLPPSLRPTIGTVAERLCVQHHTAVALVDKLESRGLIARERSDQDRREVLLKVPPLGEALLASLSSLHRDQLQTAGPELIRMLRRIVALSERPATALAATDAASGASAPAQRRRRAVALSRAGAR
jgi:DNA-binding MarR family transcriptional regulator